MLKSLAQTSLIFLILSACILTVHGQDNTPGVPGHSHTLYFRLDQCDIDRTYLSNRYVLHTLDSLFSNPSRVLSIDSVHIYSYASPEGKEVYNIRLARRRSDAMNRYLTENYPLLSKSRVSYFSGGENWDGLLELIQQDENFNERTEVLMILEAVKSPARREELLKRLNAGLAYKYLLTHVLPLLRNAMTCVVWLNPHLVSMEQRCPCPLPPLAYTLPPSMLHTPYMPVVKPHRYSALKTNLAAWAMTTVNLAYEVQTGKHFSLNLPLMWSSWDVTRRHALRIIALQPELRYWSSTPGRGHFFGIHAHAARYNLKWNEVRYQDTGCPLLGAGLSYGYLLPFNDTWGMEFTLGAGYARTRYNLYHNAWPVSAGRLFDTRTLNYWGITRIGLSFIYKLSQP